MKILMYIFGLVSGIVVSYAIFTLSEFHVAVYSISTPGNITKSNFSMCNEFLKIEGVKFVVGPTRDGYNVMISTDVDTKKRKEILEAIRLYLSGNEGKSELHAPTK